MQNRIKTYAVYHTVTIVECSLLVYIYLLQFEKKKTRNGIKIFYGLFMLLAIFIMLIKGGYNKQDSILGSYEAIFLIFLSVGYFYKLMTELNIPKLNEYYFTWINTGVLIYFSTGFILSLFSGYIERRGIKIYSVLYSFHWTFHIIYNILLSLGIWKIKRR